MVKIKIFNGEEYFFNQRYKYKREAEQRAKGLRAIGFNARVIKQSGKGKVWVVYQSVKTTKPDTAPDIFIYRGKQYSRLTKSMTNTEANNMLSTIQRHSASKSSAIIRNYGTNYYIYTKV